MKEIKKPKSKENITEYLGLASGDLVLLLVLYDEPEFSPVIGATIMAQAFGIFLSKYMKDKKKKGYLLAALLPLALAIYFTVLFLSRLK